jgi:hypothetical protein
MFSISYQMEIHKNYRLATLNGDSGKIEEIILVFAELKKM